MYSGSIPRPHLDLKFPKIWQAYFGEFLAGAEGIEPSSAVLETDILPLNYAPKTTLTHLFFVSSDPDSLRQDSTPVQKIKWKYYTFLIAIAQVKFKSFC